MALLIGHPRQKERAVAHRETRAANQAVFQCLSGLVVS